MIRVGIGGWVFEPWRGAFYPKGLPQARELEYASRKLTAIEINATFYRTQKAESFRKWAAETPDEFVFSLKGPQFATNRRVLAEAGPSIERFFASGVFELKSKLGPVLWQMAPTKKFDPEDFAAFLALLPPRLDGRPIRHVVGLPMSPPISSMPACSARQRRKRPATRRARSSCGPNAHAVGPPAPHPTISPPSRRPCRNRASAMCSST